MQLIITIIMFNYYFITVDVGKTRLITEIIVVSTIMTAVLLVILKRQVTQ